MVNGVYVLSAKRHKRVSKWYCAANDLTIFRCSMQQRYASLVKRVLPSMVTYCAVTYCSLTVHLFFAFPSSFYYFLLLSTTFYTQWPKPLVHFQSGQKCPRHGQRRKDMCLSIVGL